MTVILSDLDSVKHLQDSTTQHQSCCLVDSSLYLKLIKTNKIDFNYYYINKVNEGDTKEIKNLVKDHSKVQTSLQFPIKGFKNWLINLPVVNKL